MRASNGTESIADSVSCLIELSGGQIMAVYGDNSILILSLPDLSVVSRLEASWLLSGDMSSVRAIEKRYVFLCAHHLTAICDDYNQIPSNDRNVDSRTLVRPKAMSS